MPGASPLVTRSASLHPRDTLLGLWAFLPLSDALHSWHGVTWRNHTDRHPFSMLGNHTRYDRGQHQARGSPGLVVPPSPHPKHCPLKEKNLLSHRSWGKWQKCFVILENLPKSTMSSKRLQLPSKRNRLQADPKGASSSSPTTQANLQLFFFPSSPSLYYPFFHFSSFLGKATLGQNFSHRGQEDMCW